ncbi:CUB and sushi domain-containing protein 3-like [Clavelina lepadiformis]|uniref:CUB and sushi domain-containing protein 3-like n=1 Tax=Clavelina lepadiformis TaxID=159417 RepID=UPI0040420D67
MKYSRVLFFLLLCPLASNVVDGCEIAPYVPNATFVSSQTPSDIYRGYYQCDPGLSADNPTKTDLFCLDQYYYNGSHALLGRFWNPDNPVLYFTCAAPSDGCGNPPLLTNGGFETSILGQNWPFEVTSAIKYFCLDGFELDAPAGEFSVCRQGNKWSLNENSWNFPRCQPDCGPPPVSKNAATFVTSTIQGSVAYYVCDPGLATSDVTNTTCRKDGDYSVSWNPRNPPKCRIPVKGCGNPPIPKHGSVLQEPPYYKGDIATYKCDHGFQLIRHDQNTNTCEGGNVWSLKSDHENFPICHAVCLALPPAPKGVSYLIEDDILSEKERSIYKLNTTIAVACLPTYRLLKNATLVCVRKTAFDGTLQDRASWQWTLDGSESHPPNVCGKDCGDAIPVANATFRSSGSGLSGRYECEPGFVTREDTMAECTINGTWSIDPLPICFEPTTGCGGPPALDNGGYFAVTDVEDYSFAVGDAVQYRCYPPFHLLPEDGGESKCLLNNTWSRSDTSQQFPVCRLGCARPPLSDDSLSVVLPYIQSDESYKPGQLAFYYCENGSTLVGESVASCIDGAWSPMPPICVETCGAPPQAKNATTYPIPPSSVEYICDEGFSTEGSTVNTCRGGEWNLIPVPKCIIPRTGCGNPRMLEQGNYSGRPPYNEGKSIQYYCLEDFEIIAPSGAVSTCIHGKNWSLEDGTKKFPKCRPTCKIPPLPPTFGYVVNFLESNENGFYSRGSTITYACVPPYALRGSGTITCAGFSWIPNDVPACVKAFTAAVIPTVLGRHIIYGPRKLLKYFRRQFNTPQDQSVNSTNRAARDLDVNDPVYVIDDVTNVPSHNSNLSPEPLRTNNSLQFNDSMIEVEINIICGFPGICLGSTIDVYVNCYEKNLLSCQQCGVGRAIIFLILMVIFGLMIFVGNALVICVGYRRWKRGNPTKLDICKISLATADIMTALQILVVMVYNFNWSMNLTPIELDAKQYALRGSAQAYAGGILLVFGVTSSLYHLLYMGVERVYAIAMPLQYKYQSKTSLYLGLLLVWVLSIVTATIFAWFPDKFTFMYMTTTFLFYPALHENSNNYGYTAAIVMMVLFYLLPFLCLTISCVFSIVFTFRKRNGKSSRKCETNSRMSASRRKQNLNVFKTVALMQIGFTTTLIPVLVVAGMFYSGRLDCLNLAQPYMIGFYLSMTNSLVNVIIYSAREGDFRREIIDIFRPGYLRSRARERSITDTNKKIFESK